ncbi:hypothetical protein [Deinococcus altitudinis]|uniref:hypothetical protein n=1 Tax=Deinococcus altitudinis TaxID=468914 RepID=UPI003892C64B
MSKERQLSLGYKPTMLSIVKRYVDVVNGGFAVRYDEPSEIRQHSSILSAINQRTMIKKSISKRYSIRPENLNKNLHQFIECYQKLDDHLKLSTVKQGIVKIKRFFGYKHYIRDEIGVDNIEIHSTLNDELVDIITPEIIEGFFNYMRIRNGGITRTAVQIAKTVFSLLDIDKPWTTHYINPLRSKDRKITNISHSYGKRGILDDIKRQYYETDQKIYINRHSELTNIEGNIFSALTLEEQDVYLYQAQIGYINSIRPKIQKLIEKYEEESNNNGMTRNPFLPLMPLLELDEPLKPIELALQRSAADIRELIKFSQSIETARVIRNHIFVSLISLWPLRRAHWLKMTYTNDQTGHISLTEKNDLLFRIPIDDFKNSKSSEFKKQRTRGKFVEFPLSYSFSEDLIDLIKIYTKIYLPLFKNDSDIMFYSCESSLVNGCRRWQEDYLHPACDQIKISRPLLFGPHSFRHICVTNILKTGGTIDKAAILLLDRPETVRNRYSAFLQFDGLQSVVEEGAIHRKKLQGKQND